MFKGLHGRGLILCASSEPGPFGSIGMHVFLRERLQTYRSRCKPSRRNHTFGNSQGLRLAALSLELGERHAH